MPLMHAPCCRLAWVVLALCSVVASSPGCVRRSSLPASLNDQEFWGLVETLSEPAGAFNVSENLVSNEPHFPENVRRLSRARGVYIGVGPEQNFSYIARLRPAMAFIIDIRRENRNLHLLYKSLFELSSDRADFVSRLFSRPRPADLASTASVEEMFGRYDGVPPSAEQYDRNAALVREWLLKMHGLPLSPADLDGIDRVFRAFYEDGPGIQFWRARSTDVDAAGPSYRRLMTAVDATGQHRSFLSSEDAYLFVKRLQSNNLVVPVVGDFGGPAAVRRVGGYVRQHGGVIQAFYGSNVGVYLTNRQTRAFCGNLAALPAARRAWFIESDGVRSFASKLTACAPPAK